MRGGILPPLILLHRLNFNILFAENVGHLLMKLRRKINGVFMWSQTNTPFPITDLDFVEIMPFVSLTKAIMKIMHLYFGV
ncbi:hypothetical protein KSX_73770 [Ktedonospora formicarum]|uniref:Uncharacterized protein n=1 Tax=Ktedonospora formicarum TaxID=2778364 RepID=A0A8J3I4E2_9CHLR|nr:hypothetical protein KSX_73770 [Ktedonospora formicarum]